MQDGEIPMRADATGLGTFRTPDGVTHHHTGQPPITACTCQMGGIGHQQASAAHHRGIPAGSREVRNSWAPPAAGTRQRAVFSLERMRMRLRMLELAAP